MFLNKSFLTIVFYLSFLFLSDLLAQITGIKYMLQYNTETENMDCYLVIIEGNAKDIRQRVQFNSQISLVAPNGTVPVIENSYMPLNDNQTYTGTQPCKWKIMSTIISPSITPEYIYLSVVPELKVSSFYNNLKAGDKIKLFSLGVENDTVCVKSIRLFDNGTGPGSSAAGMNGSDFTNSFTLGSLQTIYKGNLKNEKVFKIFQKGKELMITGHGDSFEWYSAKDNKMIISTTEGVFIPEHAGQYYAKSVNKNCSISSDKVQFKGKKKK